ncbi:MAG: tetratricopeptide repeat protein [FCB group bacterium]|nr:tetratricopeptide repeat protein [FCB group bacterium]
MKKTILIILLPLIISSLTYGIEVKSKGENVPSEEKSADTLLQIADATFQTQDYKKALSQYQEALKRTKEEFNNSVEVETMAQIARVNLILGDKEEGRGWLKEAKARATDSDPMGWSRYLGVKGRFEWKDNDLKAARNTFDEMYNYCTVNALWGRAVDAAHMIAIVAQTPQEQIEWSRRGIEAAEAADNEKWLGPLWNNLACTYYDMKQYDSALECYKKAREYHWHYSNETAKLFADYQVGMTYRALGDYEQALKWLRPVLAWAERLNNHSAIGQTCEDLGKIDIAQGKKAEGLKLFQRAREEYKKARFDQTWPEIWNNINKLIKKQEN